MRAQALEPFYESYDPEFMSIRKTVREVLQKEDDLNEIVQLVGKARARVCVCACECAARTRMRAGLAG